jgi:hypothetical protein
MEKEKFFVKPQELIVAIMKQSIGRKGNDPNKKCPTCGKK